MTSAAAGGFLLERTGYVEHAEEILALRNANRDVAQSRAFLDWRYSSSPGAPSPKVFWLRQPDGRAVGMAAAIFRAFRVLGGLKYVGVVGDISLDTSLRGHGLGRTLLEFMTQELVRDDPDGLYCVIPNEAARKILVALGWRTLDGLVSHVLPLDPKRKVHRLLGAHPRSDMVARAAGDISAWLALRQRRPGYWLQALAAPGEALARFWEDFDKSGRVMGERGIEALTWRYVNHPNHGFQLSAFYRHDSIRGYVVHRVSEADNECSIQDFLLQDDADVGCMLGLVVNTIRETRRVETIRILVNRANPCRHKLWQMGFFPRDMSATFIMPVMVNGKKQYVQYMRKAFVGVDAETGSSCGNTRRRRIRGEHSDAGRLGQPGVHFRIADGRCGPRTRRRE